MSQDQLTRVSALVGVYKGLHLLFADETADEWARRPNRGPLFDRETPIEAMIEGGIPRMLDVRRYIDAVARRLVISPRRMTRRPAGRQGSVSATVRLVSTARLRPPVLERLVSAEDAAALAEIEGATSERLLAERRGSEGFGRGEFVHGVPYANFVNAAFAYWKPREMNRFNSTRGAWYAALDVETCIREVAYHMAEFLARSGQLTGVVDYAEMFASMAGEFVDLRQAPAIPVSIRTRRSAIRSATRSPTQRGRKGSMA